MADRELDVQIDALIFGHKVFDHQSGPYRVGGYGDEGRVPRYSSDIGAAWKVVEHMASMGLTVSVVYVASARCLCVNVDQSHHERIAELGEIGGPEIAPQVICRAAIQALAATGSADRAGREGEA